MSMSPGNSPALLTSRAPRASTSNAARANAAARQGLGAGVAVVLLAAILPASGCAPPEEVQASIAMRASGGAARLPVDGETTLEVILTAARSDIPDDRSVALSAASGVFSGEGVVVDANGNNAAITPSGGEARFRFRCSDGAGGSVVLSADNGEARGTLVVTCVRQDVSLELSADDSACAQIQADGVSSCPIRLQVRRAEPQGLVPASGVALSVSVTEATAVDESPGETRVLATTADAAGTELSALTLATDLEGNVLFYVHSTAMDLAQRVVLEAALVGAAGEDASAGRVTLEVEIAPFENRALLVLTPNPAVVGTGQSGLLQVLASNLDGTPATGAAIALSVPAGSGLELGDAREESASLVLDDSGQGTLTFRAPAVTAETQVTVSARFEPATSVAPLLADATLTIYPEDALVLRGIAEPASLRSDENEAVRVTASVQRFRNGAFEPVVGAPVSFRVRPGDAARIMLGLRPDPLPVDFAPELAATVTSVQAIEENGERIGKASVLVSAQNERVRGRTALEVSVSEGGRSYQTAVEIEVERDPIPQSLIFLAAMPETIHVRGSSFPAASVMTFQVLDDTNAPLPDVFVRFDLNRTADPNATVLGGEFTGPDGRVSTVVSAGSQAGPLSVIATASFENRTLLAESLPIVVQGGLPTFADSYIVCAPEDIAQIPPFTVDCSAVLVDRFTNRAPAGLAVHFRAEGGNVNALDYTDTEGTAGLTFATGGVGASTASLLSASFESWSYAAILPATPLQLSTDAERFTTATRSACFDAVGATECDLVGLCRVPLNAPYCPLGLDFASPNDSCWEHLNAFAVTGDPDDIGPELLSEITRLRGGNVDVIADRNEARNYLVNTFEPSLINGFNYFIDDAPNAISNHEYVVAIVDTYLDNQFRCGFQSSCLMARREGLSFIAHDDCPLAPGCMDFSAQTDCPQDGLRSITAYFRGEESFIDVNGNGRFDYDDANGSGQHDTREAAFEPYIDLPEPYLDRNDNCVYDDLSGSRRLQPIERVQHSDLFSDADGSGDFGFRDLESPAAPRDFTNRHWDRDTQVFLSTHLLALGPLPFLEYGQPCEREEIGTAVACDLADRFAAKGVPTSALCREAGPGKGLAPGCITPIARASQPVPLGPSDGFRLGYRWRDLNGNCFSPGFASVANVGSEGNLLISGDTQTTLDQGRCGYQDSARNPSRPWCSEQPALGASVVEIGVAANCAPGAAQEGGEEGSTGKITLSLGEEQSDFSVRVQCPICGNGALEEGETCDDGNAIAGDGCDEQCKTEAPAP